MSTSLATPVSNAGRSRPRKPRFSYHEADLGLVLMTVGILYGLWLSFRFDPTYGFLPAGLLVLGFLLVVPEVRRISRRGRRVAQR